MSENPQGKGDSGSGRDNGLVGALRSLVGPSLPAEFEV